MLTSTLRRFASVRLGLLLFGLAMLGACGNTPPAPDWQSNALGAMKGFTSAYLTGKTLVAEVEFARTRGEIAATGRPDLVARAELVRCAAKVASLDLDNCAAKFADAEKAPDVPAPERAYAEFLAGGTPQAALLPEQHRAMFSARDDGARVATLTAVQDPLSRLVAAGVLLQQGQLPPAGVALAVDTASDQGWRRPLLAWLGVQLKLAQTAANPEAQARIQRRIDVVVGSGVVQ